MSQLALSGVPDSESKTASTPAFPCLPYSWSLTLILHHAVTSLGLTINSEECQAECSTLWQSWGLDDRTKLKDGYPLQVLRLYHELKAHLKAKYQVEERRKTSRLLDRRKGGALHLSEEAAQLAKSVTLLEGSGNPPPEVLAAVIQAKVTIQDLHVGALGLPWASGIGIHCYCKDHQRDYAGRPEVAQFLKNLKQSSVR